MEYLALLMPALVLGGLPLVDRLERWAAGPTTRVEHPGAAVQLGGSQEPFRPQS
ncbi:MAG: hypothetical protein ACJ73E_05290 [Mycobacteriales bacterium]